MDLSASTKWTFNPVSKSLVNITNSYSVNKYVIKIQTFRAIHNPDKMIYRLDLHSVAFILASNLLEKRGWAFIPRWELNTGNYVQLTHPLLRTNVSRNTVCQALAGRTLQVHAVTMVTSHNDVYSHTYISSHGSLQWFHCSNSTIPMHSFSLLGLSFLVSHAYLFPEKTLWCTRQHHCELSRHHQVWGLLMLVPINRYSSENVW